MSRQGWVLGKHLPKVLPTHSPGSRACGSALDMNGGHGQSPPNAFRGLPRIRGCGQERHATEPNYHSHWEWEGDKWQLAFLRNWSLSEGHSMSLPGTTLLQLGSSSRSQPPRRRGNAPRGERVHAWQQGGRGAGAHCRLVPRLCYLQSPGLAQPRAASRKTQGFHSSTPNQH